MSKYKIDEAKIRSSDAFKNLQEAYESTLQMKTDLIHSRISAGLNHGLAIGYLSHLGANPDKNQYIAPTLLGTGSNQYGQLGKQVNTVYTNNQDRERFEKIFLVHNQEEYYPIQVCCGYSFSLILAIEGKNLQWLDKLTQAKAEKYEKSEYQNIKQEMFQELLSKTKIFFAGEIGIHQEDNPAIIKTEKKRNFLRHPTKLKTRNFDRNVLRIDLGQKNHTIVDSNQYSENDALLANNQVILDIEENNYSDDDEDDDNDTKTFTNREQEIKHEEKYYKYCISDVVQLPKGIGGRKTFVVQICCGLNFCLILTYNFQVLAWGDNSYGNIGTGDLDYQEKPKIIQFDENKGDDSRIQFISCGANHCAAVSLSGKLYTWGQGIQGQLGHQNVMNLSIPTAVKSELQEKKVVYVSCGGAHTVCLTNEGYAYSFGNNKNGQLGLGDQEQRNVPVKIQKLQNYFIVNVVCGMNNTFILTQVGKIFACGSNQHNKLGLDQLFYQKDNFLNPIDLDINFLKGVNNPNLKDVYIYQIAASPHFTYALSNQGLLTTWGLQVNDCLGRSIDNYISEKMKNLSKNRTNMLIPCSTKFRNQIDSYTTYHKFYYPIQNSTIFRASEKDFISNDIVDIELGVFHTMALTNAGEIYVWGSNQMCQHGCISNIIRQEYDESNEKNINIIQNDISKETLPSVVSFFNIKENRRITYIAAGYEYCMAIENKRLVYAWGRNTDGQLGIGKTQYYVESPQMVLGLEGNLMKAIACGENHTLFLTDTGQVYSCGSSKDGKLGLGNRTNTQLQPQLITNLSKVEQISCGQSHSMALAQDDFFKQDDDEEHARQINVKMVVYTWGNAWESKLGHGDRENLYEPTKIQSNYLFKYISAGSHHSAALTTDDNLVVWGPYKYFGHTKPDENIKGKKVITTQHEYHEFMKPTLHPKITEKVRHVCLGDKTTFIVAKKDNKIYQYGIFETDFKELLKIHKNNNEHILEKILPFRGGTGDQEYYEVPVNEIKKIAVSKDHVAVIGKNQVYTWGYDNLTGRLGHGYMFKDTNKNQIENIQNEEQAEADQRQKPQHDLTKKLEKPEYCNYINKYLQEQLKIFQKKQQQGNEEAEEEGEKSSDDDSDPRADEEKGFEDQNREDKKSSKQYTQIRSMQGTKVNTVKSVTVISSATHDNRQQTQFFNRDNQNRQNTMRSKKALTIVQNQNIFLINNKQNNQQLYEQFFQNPLNVKSTYEKLTARDKPDLYSILSEQYGLLNEERILYVYDKVTALQGEIFLRYQICQQHLNHNKAFKRAAQSQVLKRIASQPFNISYSEKNSNILLKQDQYQPFLSNKFYYKKLFTLMQLHPCYLIKIYEKKMDKDQFIQLVKETFGELENSARKQRLYTELCKKILYIDLKENNSIKDSRKPLVLNTDKNSSFSYVFVKLFIHFYESMSDLIQLNRKFRLKVVKTLEDLIQTNSSKYQVSEDLFVLDRKHIAESGDYYKTDEQIKEQLDRNQYSVKEYLQHFFKDRDFLQAASSQKVIMCEKLRELIGFAIEYIQQKRPFEIIENIQYCILGIIFQSMLDSCQSLYSNQNGSNFEWIIKAIKMYIFLDEKDKKNQDINIFIEYIKQQDDERSKIYELLVGKSLPKKQISYYNFIQDIYSHSIENQDDYALISLSTLEKLTKFVQRVNIQFNPKEEEDFFFKCCKSLKDEQPNFVTSTVEKQHEQLKVKIKLETRQLFYSSNQFLKKCSDCETVLQRDFLRSHDMDVKEQFQMFNPSSLESCIVKLVQVITKQNYDDLLAGKQQIQHLCGKFIAKLQNKANKDGKNLVQNIQIVKNFSKAFENAYELEYSNESQSEKLIIPSDLSKQVLKSLINRIDNQINQVVKYYNKMETLYRVYFSIKTVLDKFISNVDIAKSQQFKIITNSYYGIANRDLEKVIERDPIAITSKISASIHGMDLSTFLYENIDVFSNKKLNNIKDDYQKNKIKDHFIQLNMFGEYSIYQLKQKGVIKSIDDEVEKKQKKDIKSDIEKCLFYIFNDYGNKYVSVDVVYKGGEISILTILCGLKGSKELRIDHFRIDRDTILSLRKQRIREDISKQTIKFGFTTFQKSQLLKLLEKMEDHYSVYEYIYSSNNCTV